MTNETNNVGMMTFRLPRVSARKPHKGLDVMIPTKAIALSNPLPFVVRFKSHSAIGKMNETPRVSNKTVAHTAPLRITKK